MLRTITRMEKMAALQVVYSKLGMLCGSIFIGEVSNDEEADAEVQSGHTAEHRDIADIGASDESETSIRLAMKRRASNVLFCVFLSSQMNILQSLNILADSSTLLMQSDAQNFLRH
jgi:hypothetical protein